MSKVAGHDFNNVVNFSPVQDQRKPAYYPPLLLSGHKFALHSLDKSLKTLFNNADDCLFEYADKAENNKQQTFYFDAMRQVRVKRDAITNSFFQAFENAFKNSVEGIDSGDFDWAANQPRAGLSLVEESDLELNLAIDNMEQRIQVECREQLSGLLMRLNELGCVTTFNRNNHPFSAQSICKSFSTAVEAMEFELEIQLIVLKLFDKFVVRDMKQIYTGINDIFVKAGVLPHIRYRIPPIQNSAGAAKPTLQSNSATAVNANEQVSQQPIVSANGSMQFHNSEDLFAAMRRLIAPPRLINTPVQNSSAALESAPIAAPIGANFISVDNLIAELSGMQSQLKWQSLTPGAESVQQIQAALASQASGSTLSRVDADTINIIALMFEMILDDEQIPSDIKNQVNRLQVPFIKVATLDKSLFSNKKHPARLLLNELSRSFEAIDADVSEYKTLYDKIVSVVDKIIIDFNDDMEIFSHLLKDFRHFVSEEKSINQQAENLLLIAKDKAAQALEKRIADHRLPRNLLQFLLGPWKEVLTRVALRDKANSAPWKHYVRCIDQLIWSAQNKSSRFERQALADLLPDLLARIKSGLAIADIEGAEQQAVLKDLQEMHISALKSEFSPIVDADNVDAREANQAHAKEGIWAEIDAKNIRHEDYIKELHDKSLMASPHYQSVTQMELGTWLNFRNGDKLQKGKLCWRCDFTGEYLFMTRLYRVVADLNLKELIAKLENGEASVIEQLPLFDRAVNAIFKKVSIRKLQQTAV